MCFNGAIVLKSYVKWRGADSIGEDCLSRSVYMCVERERGGGWLGRKEICELCRIIEIKIMWHHSFSITNAIFLTGSL